MHVIGFIAVHGLNEDTFAPCVDIEFTNMYSNSLTYPCKGGNHYGIMESRRPTMEEFACSATKLCHI